MTRCRLTLLLLTGLLWASCSRNEEKPKPNLEAAREAKREIKELRDSMAKLETFFKPMGKPGSNDWLASHTEPGQTFEEYLDSKPTKPTKERQTVYILPLGNFSPDQKKVIAIAAGYLSVFYDVPITELPVKPLTVTTPHFRVTPRTKVRQIKTGHILNDVLRPQLAADAAALIAFTTDDLYPDESMNYVFGQASLENRVGVWSLHRLDDNANYDTFLRRTLKIAAHETGHMFTMRHCTKYECLMSGTNYLGETDRRPIDACPECSAKICWLSDTPAASRYQRLAEYARKNGLVKEAAEFERKASAVIKRTSAND